MSDRRPYLAANWKMHKTVGEAAAFFDGFLGEVERVEADIVICPSFTALRAAVERCRGTAVRVAAQNMHQDAEGAYTGEVSARMLSDVGVDAVVLGHSERRQYFAESDGALARKLGAALAAGLEPILCVGESEQQRDADQTEGVLARQVRAALEGASDDHLARVVIAYEPIWAIGTGRTATSDQAQAACAHIRSLVGEREATAAASVRVLYGGSVKPANAVELLGQADIDGALVGGAALEPANFLAICRAA